ncbi:MAG: ATP-binding protein [Ruminococcus sp.]|nr:ATP-binding protein [Ruminococcus sp.]
MNNSDNKIYFNFSYLALRLLGKGLYSNAWTAIAELVANGFDAKATNVKIYINAIDKEHSVIEIFDNGYGMGYNDLSEKYTLIGKDKRDDATIDEKTKNQLMGRKGIGKLAALFLSHRYYLISKTKDEVSAWCLDASNAKDSDIPHLDRQDIDEINIETKSDWDSFQTGTMIKLTDVDLTNFGEQSLAGLKARLSDFYLLNSLHGKVEVAFLTKKSTKCIFEKVEKSIAFKNMYAFYNNTDYDYALKLSNTVRFRSSVEAIESIPRDVLMLNIKDFPNTSGKRHFIQKDGTLTETEIPYKMTGWIGIHSSINKEDAVINDPEFLKNKTYSPNQLRLYVRNKLAVENFLDYVKNTQAFSNYIEGEISFDILDDNRLADIATSNRQGFIEDDERVLLLIEILKPIISSLIKERVKIGHQIREEEKDYYERIKQQQEEKRQKEEQARKQAEEERKIALSEKKAAERKAEKLNEKLETVNADLGTEKKRTSFLMDSLSINQMDIAKRLHMAKININTITTIIKKLVLKNNMGRLTLENVWDDIKSISFSAERVKANLTYGMKATFNTQEEKIEADIFGFISDYCKTIFNHREITIIVENNGQAIIKFAPQNIAVVLENILSNSQKAHATSLTFRMYENEEYYFIDAVDNGNDNKWRKVSELNSLFEFGKGYTQTGSGIGLYHIKEIMESMNGSVTINDKNTMGFELNMRIKK